MQVMKGNLVNRIEAIMGTEATVKQYKEFLVYVAKELKMQEKMKQVKLKNNLYDTVLYYLENRAKSTGHMNKRNRRSYKSKYTCYDPAFRWTRAQTPH